MNFITEKSIGSSNAFCFVLLKVGIITYVLYEKQYALFLIVCIFSRLNLIYLLEYYKFSKDKGSCLAFSLRFWINANSV